MLSVTALGSLFSTTNTTSYATGSYTPKSHRLLVAFVATTGAQVNPSSVSGNGLTWSQKAAQNIGAVARLMLYVTDAGAAPEAGALTVTYAAGQTGQTISVFEIEGADLAQGALAAVVQALGNEGTGTSGSVALGALTGGANRPIAAFIHAANEAASERTNWTEIHDGGFATPVFSMESQWRTDAFELTASASWATSSGWAGIAAEVAAKPARGFRGRRTRLGLAL